MNARAHIARALRLPRVRAIRGAITVTVDDRIAIAAAVVELIDGLRVANRFVTADLISAIFTVRPDLRVHFRPKRPDRWAGTTFRCCARRKSPFPGHCRAASGCCCTSSDTGTSRPATSTCGTPRAFVQTYREDLRGRLATRDADDEQHDTRRERDVDQPGLGLHDNCRIVQAITSRGRRQVRYRESGGSVVPCGSI